MKLITVTGASGFIGRAIVKELLAENFNVRAVDKTIATNQSKTHQHLTGDLRDKSFALEAMKGADFCIALAGLSGGVGYLSQHPATILSDNLLITENTINSCRKNDVCQLIYTSSSCVFSANKSPPFKEADITNTAAPLAGYAFSKLASEKLCEANHDEHGLEYTIVRPFNVYGPGEPAGPSKGYGHVIPELSHHILFQNPPITLFGDGKQTRSFLYIEDLVRAFLLMIGNKNAKNRAFNIGSTSEISMVDLANKIWNLSGRQSRAPIAHLQKWRDDVARRSCDYTLAKDILGWEPQVNLDTGLMRYLHWCKKTSESIIHTTAH